MRRTSANPLVMGCGLAALALGLCLAQPARALVTLESVASVASGGYSTCALTTGGGVKCWGLNTDALLGNPAVTTGTRATPLDVAGLSSGIVAIASGERHQCALTNAGGVKCWGVNANGQLGDNSTIDRSSPVDVSGLSGVVAIAAGFFHTCAVTNAGAVKCWGFNSTGQLGNNSTTQSAIPVDVTGLSGVAGIAAGGNHTCAFTTGGAVKCWGRNLEGQVGDSSNTQRNTPADVTGLGSGVTALATGRFHTCAVTGSGGLKCWGNNSAGQLGNGLTANTNAPVDVSGLASGVQKAALGRIFSCALTTGGGVKCWGSNPYGQVGDNSYVNRLTPADVAGLASGASVLSVGNYHACAVVAGSLRCWGNNGAGQLGDGSVQQRLVPVDVVGIGGGATNISARGSRSCAVGGAGIGGSVKCWGDNFNGAIGDGTFTNAYSASQVTDLTSDMHSVSTGYDHTCALGNDAGVRCWGLNSSGQVGDGTTTTRLTPVPVSGLASGVLAISSGYAHACALTTANGVKCWGRNAEGQLGNGSTTASSVPVDVSGLTSGVAAISGGGYHTCAVLTGGGVKCWGYNFSGQLGNSANTNTSTPVDVAGLASGVASVAAGGYHTCVVTTGGAVKCWGYNGNGGLGDNTFVNRNAPVDVVGLSAGIASLSAGEYHMCAVTTVGGVKCWGYNNSALLGDYSSINRRAPVDVVDLPSGVVQVAAGAIHNCARTSTNAVKCWGFAGEGQIGDGIPATRPTAAPVMTVDETIVPTFSSSQTHTLALDADGKVYAWGSDSHGQLGQGRAINRSTPAQVAGIPSMSRISLSQHALAVDVFGQVWAWGENSCGQLGPRGEVGTSKPSRVLGATGFTQVASGGCFSLARKSDGSVWGWGLVPGYGTDTGLRQLAGIANAVDIAAGSTHALVRRSDNTVMALGDNARGQLGQGGTGAARAAVVVAGAAGALEIAAGDDASMARLASGQLVFWGARSDASVVSTPTALPAPASAPASISIGRSLAHAALANGTVARLASPYVAWQAIAGFAGIGAIEAGAEFQLGIAGGGQLFASGSNTAGQLGQGNTNSFTGALAVAGMTSVSQVVAGAVNPSVLALKSDGTVWFWGADTLGESGDGAAVGSSVPRLVTLPAKVRQVATGDRFSLAFDIDGNVWGWGDNAGSSLDGTLVNRSLPALVSGAFHVQKIAAGGPAVALFLRTDGKVTRGGTLAGSTTSAGPLAIIGLDNIVSIAAGTSAYALRNDNVLLALGGNASGELGNGTTSTSATPVQVQGITGTIASISAGAGRAAAVTGDGKVWSWGAGPLGNGSAAGSSTAVQATGIGDAVEASVGKLATLVRRQGGALSAWGDTALADMPANPLLPYPIAFHQPVKSARIGANNALGYIVGNTGLAWAFGRYLTVSNLTAAIGDGTYVPRPRPVVILAAGGAGNIDTGDWYFDLEPASAESIPAASTPKMLGVTRISGSEGGLAFGATVRHKSADFGKSVNNYVFGLVPPAFFDAVKRAPGVSSKAQLALKATKADGYVLAQLTPQGWLDVSGQLIAHSQGTANAAGAAATILSGVPAASIPGARFCIGYGESAGSMLQFAALREVLLLPGAAQNTSGVPCILTGVYVDGPVGSRVSTAVTFKASVVGLSPTGAVQFKDGAQALSGSVTLGGENDAVASAQLATSALAVGEHSIGATYFGDGQNAATSTEIPLRHLVTSAATQASLVGPSSSDEFSQVAFEAVVIGLNPSGTVQFKDGAANIGAAVPLVGGQAVLRISTLALGDHNITAEYLSDNANNANTTSNVVAHKVLSVLRTRMEVTSSAADPLVGQSITLTATVTGNNPTGSVTFRDGTTVLGSANLVNGVATLTISNLGSGLHLITASYAGDGDDDAVSSPTLTQNVVTPALFSMNPGTLAFGGQLRNTTSGVRAVTITNAGGAPLTVTSVAAVGAFSQTNNCATLAGGASCTISVRFSPTSEGALNGSINIQTSLGPQVITLSGTGAPSLVGHYYTSILRRAPDPGGQAFWDAEAVRVSALGVNVNEVWFAMAQAFYFSAEYAALNRDNSGFVTDLYTTFFQRAPDQAGLDFWVGQLNGGMPREVALASFMFSAEFVGFAQARYGNTAARAEMDAVTDFYRGLLARLPDDSGFNFWVGRFRAAQCAGQAQILAEVEAISSAYALSQEYTNRARTNVQYVGDLYNAFLRRGGDLAGVLFWINQVASGAQTREQVRVQFRNSAEFQARVAAIVAQGCLP